MNSQNTLEPPLTIAAAPRVGYILLGITAVLYGALLLFLPVNAPSDIYNSPDEMANAFFGKGIAEDGHITRNAFHKNLPSSVTPRSILRANDSLIPVGFVSVPVLFSIFIKLFGFKGMMLFFAAFAALALLAWHQFLRAVFGSRLALLTTFLTAIHPLILYWNERPLIPSAWFLSCIFVSLYFLGKLMHLRSSHLPSDIGIELESPVARQRKAERYIFSALGGFLFGLALVLRPQEAIWLLLIPLGLLVTSQFRKKVSLLPYFVGAAIPISLLLILQRSLYGSVLGTGYHLTPFSAPFLEILGNFIMPFGFDPEHMLSIVATYGGGMVWWSTSIALLGMVAVAFRKDGRLLKRLRVWFMVFLCAAVWLVWWYGSFVIHDRIDTLASIGTSFTRYFLPLYAMMMPFVAYALFRIRARLGGVVVAIVVVLLAVLSLRIAMWSTDESLAAIPDVLMQNQQIQKRVVDVTPPDAIIFTERLDKAIFPAREVVTRFRTFDQPRFEELYGFNLYYETIADPSVVAWEQSTFWGPHGLEAVNPVALGYRHTLYKLEILNPKL